MTAPAIIQRYFDLAGQPDRDAYLALFDEDATVQDEGQTYRGIDEIRRWRGEVPLVRYDITDTQTVDDATVVTATITGDFPGSPFAGLKFRFDRYDDEHIHHLTIAP